jgi:hypothetical protein
MPEGHTIHRIAKDHGALLIGLAVQVSSLHGRFEADAARIDGLVRNNLAPFRDPRPTLGCRVGTLARQATVQIMDPPSRCVPRDHRAVGRQVLRQRRRERHRRGRSQAVPGFQVIWGSAVSVLGGSGMAAVAT